MNKILGSSPVMSIVGYITAIALAVQPFVTNEGFDIKKDWMMLLFAVLAAIGGRAAKDSNGITAKQSKVVAKIATDGLIPPTKDDSAAV